MKISVIGLGYIGLPTAAVAASKGVDVVGIDINSATVATINSGKIHIVEPGLDKMVANVVASGHLRATVTPEACDAFLIAVPTPFKDDHMPDLAYVESAARAIAPVLARGNTVILESTSPVGTTEGLAKLLTELRPDLRFAESKRPDDDFDVHIAYCPERVLPGNVLHELVHNDRIIGGLTPKSSEMAIAVYANFVDGACIPTTAETAELCKLTENSFRDVNIAFANELSVIADHHGVSVWELIELANRHPRVKILQPGPGVGGHCIAVDPWFIVSACPDKAKLIATARNVNDGKPAWVIDKIDAAAREFETAHGSTPTVALFGLSFKPNIDDLRESPSLEIARIVARRFGAGILAVEPNITELPTDLADAGVILSDYAAAGRADIAVLLVDHDVFRKQPAPSGMLIDTRGLWR